MSKIIAAYGGGFKPPTGGHFEIVKRALNDYPEIDEFIIYVGAKEREGMDQEESILVWDIYHNYLANKVKIEPVKQPIGDIIRLAKNNLQDTIYFIIGYRDGREDDLIDVAARTGNLKEKYPNIEVKVIGTQDPNMSGTNARKALTLSQEEFNKYLPIELTSEEKIDVYNILKPAEKLNEDIPSEVINSFNIQDTLVTDVWEDNKLKPEIREKLLVIAQDFFDSLELPKGTVLKDIKLTGSLANYNWSKFSDVDLHLVLDYSQIADDEEFARDYFLAKKSIWNQTHDIDMFGYPVEVYVEDENDDHTASGLYSILNDEWINEPVLNKIIIDKEDIKSKAEGYLTQLPQIEMLFNKGEYQKVISSVDLIKERLRNMRSSGLLKGGEYSVENLAFKVLRRTDFVLQLNDLKTKSYDMMMSINENVTKTQLDSIEDYADKLFAKLGIDIEFTKHFLDRLNDKRNNKPISVAELIGMFKRLHRKHGKSLSKIDVDFDAVVKDFNSNINIPFAINVTPKDIDLVAKTVMRKKDFKTSTPVIALEEEIIKLIKENNIVLPVDEPIILQADSEKYKRGLIVTWKSDGGYDVQYWYETPDNIVPAELRGDGESFGDIKNVYLGYHPQLDKEKINENATYSNNIDYKKQIKDLTKHMISKGMNIKPLPKVKFIHNDQENAQDFLGKTAYYDPNNQTITLYTEGRHPKDIVRSFSHEMIHHIQFLEDRLDGVNTTNTMEDDNLNNIEREAYTDGNMTFRNWTDTINEAIVDDKIECDNCDWSWDIASGGNDLFICHECGHDNEPVSEGGSLIPIKIKKTKPDPFGLNAYARELAMGLEEVINDELLMKDIEIDHPITESTDYKIFSDMDGVLTDFDESFKKYSKGIAPRDYEKKFGKEKFWELIDGTGKVGFWVGMPWMGDGKQYWDYIKNYDTELLSSPSRSSTSRLGKRLWVRNNMPGIKLTLAQAAHKQNYAAPNHILIDDRKSNIDQWVSKGGIGILHTSASDTISQLKQLGL